MGFFKLCRFDGECEVKCLSVWRNYHSKDEVLRSSSSLIFVGIGFAPLVGILHHFASLLLICLAQSIAVFDAVMMLPYNPSQLKPFPTR
jgi:hypothetical protein